MSPPTMTSRLHRQMINKVSSNILVMPLGKLVASYDQITRKVTQHNEITIILDVYMLCPVCILRRGTFHPITCRESRSDGWTGTRCRHLDIKDVSGEWLPV